MALSRREILERERRGQRLAAYSAIAAAPLLIASLFIQQNTGVPGTGLVTEQIRALDEVPAQLLVSAGLQAAAYLLTIPMLLYLFRAAQARNERVSGPMVGFVFIGPLLLAIQSVISWVAQTQLASDFVAQARAGGDIYTLVDDLADDNTLLQFVSALILPASLGFIVAMFYVSLQAMRVGLVTRMAGTLGMALGASTLILGAVGTMGTMVWLGWVGFTILDKTPKGRPPAWAAGEAIPWPKPGDEPQPAVAAEAPVDAEATEVFTEPAPAEDHSARRERARKRKRKRRR